MQQNQYRFTLPAMGQTSGQIKSSDQYQLVIIRNAEEETEHTLCSAHGFAPGEKYKKQEKTTSFSVIQQEAR